MDQALYAVVMESYAACVSTRKVDALVAALGSQSGSSKSQVSPICADIDIQVHAFLSRPLESGAYAYLYLDATYLHGRLGRAMQVYCRAVVVAMGVNAGGRRELLGLKVGDSESETFWSDFIGSLKERGLTGVKLAISDVHKGLTKAIRRMCQPFTQPGSTELNGHGRARGLRVKRRGQAPNLNGGMKDGSRPTEPPGHLQQPGGN